MAKVLAFFLLLMFTQSAFADVLLASWNLKRLGHAPAKNIAVVLDVLDDYEIIALQEVMRPSAWRGSKSSSSSAQAPTGSTCAAT